MARVFAYGRASTDKQQITLVSQEHICRTYFDMKSAQDPSITWAGWYPDADVSSKLPLFHRPMGERILRQILPGDYFLTSNFDRAFRSVIDCCNSMNVMLERKINLVILDMDVNTSTPFGRFFMKIMAIIKEVEREEIGRRTSEALQTKKRLGEVLNPWTPIGWKKLTKHTMTACVEERRICKEIVRLHDKQKLSFQRISDLLKAKKILTQYNTQWNHPRVRGAYVSAKCGFPKMPILEMPTVTEVKRFMRAHGGRPPLLERTTACRGRGHTLKPMPDRPPVFEPQADPECP